MQHRETLVIPTAGDWEKDRVDADNGVMRVLHRSNGKVAVAVAWVDGQFGDNCEIWIDIEDPAGGARIVLVGNLQFESIALAMRIVHARIRQQTRDRKNVDRFECFRREPSGSFRIGGSPATGWQFFMKDLQPGSWADAAGFQSKPGRGEKGQFSDWLPGVHISDAGFDLLTHVVLAARQDRLCSGAQRVLDLGRSSFLLAPAFRLMPLSESDPVDAFAGGTAKYLQNVRSKSRRAVLSRIQQFQQGMAEAIAARDTFALRRAGVPAVLTAPAPAMESQKFDAAPAPSKPPPFVEPVPDAISARLFRAAIPN